MINPVVKRCWEVREQLVKKFGGIDGLMDEMERLDRKRLRAAAAKKKAKPTESKTNKRSPSKRPKSN